MPTRLLHRCIDSGRHRKVGFAAKADNGHSRAGARLSEALASYSVVRMVHVRQRGLKNRLKAAELVAGGDSAKTKANVARQRMTFLQFT